MTDTAPPRDPAPMTDEERRGYMRRAIETAYKGMQGGWGGPFGAVIVKDGVVLGEGHNEVVKTNDPTAHAEVTAIRRASAAHGHFDLSGAEIFVNGLPCPMCMTAIFWSRISRIWYACLPEDAEAIGFDDEEFYRELAKPVTERTIPTLHMADMHAEARDCYQAWLTKDDRTPY